MGFNSAFKGLKLLKNAGNGRLNNLNDPPPHPQCVNSSVIFPISFSVIGHIAHPYNRILLAGPYSIFLLVSLENIYNFGG